MQQKIRQVRTKRTFAKHFRVQHQGQPCQRMPVARVSRGESPDEIRRFQPALDVGIGREIVRVINIKKITMHHRPINRVSVTVTSNRQRTACRANTFVLPAGSKLFDFIRSFTSIDQKSEDSLSARPKLEFKL